MTTTRRALEGPSLRTPRSKATSPPLGTAASATRLVTARSAAAVAGSVSVASLSVSSASPPPATDAVFWSVGGAGSWTSALTSIGGYDAPAARGSDRVQVSVVVPAVTVQFHPGAESTVTWSKPAGKTSRSVTGEPSVAIVPL